MCDIRVFRLGILEILNRRKVLLSQKISSRFSNAWKLFLRGKCVLVRLLSISCSVIPLHRFAFSAVSQSRFQARDLTYPYRCNVSLKCPCGCLTSTHTRDTAFLRKVRNELLKTCKENLKITFRFSILPNSKQIIDDICYTTLYDIISSLFNRSWLILEFEL